MTFSAGRRRQPDVIVMAFGFMIPLVSRVEAVRSTTMRTTPSPTIPEILRRGSAAWSTWGTDFYDHHKNHLLSGECPPRHLVRAQMDATAL